MRRASPSRRRAAVLSASPVPHYHVRALCVRCDTASATLAYSGDSGQRGPGRGRARKRVCFSARRRSSSEADGDPRGTCRRTRRSRRSRQSGAKKTAPHTPAAGARVPTSSGSFRRGSSSRCRGRSARVRAAPAPRTTTKTITPSSPPKISPTGTKGQTAPSCPRPRPRPTGPLRAPGLCSLELRSTGGRPVGDEPVRGRVATLMGSRARSRRSGGPPPEPGFG